MCACPAGASYHSVGYYLRAIKEFHEAIRLGPDHAELYPGRGAAYREPGQYARTMKDCDKAKELNSR